VHEVVVRHREAPYSPTERLPARARRLTPQIAVRYVADSVTSLLGHYLDLLEEGATMRRGHMVGFGEAVEPQAGIVPRRERSPAGCPAGREEVACALRWESVLIFTGYFTVFGDRRRDAEMGAAG
jgi:hypothetical protein